MAIPPGAYTDRDYSPDELEFLKAMDRYKRVSRRPHPTWREVYQVFMALGYRKRNEREESSVHCRS